MQYYSSPTIGAHILLRLYRMKGWKKNEGQKKKAGKKSALFFRSANKKKKGAQRAPIKNKKKKKGDRKKCPSEKKGRGKKKKTEGLPFFSKKPKIASPSSDIAYSQ